MVGVNGLNVVKAVEEEVGEKVEHVNSENLVKLAAPEKQMLPKPVMKKPVQVTQFFREYFPLFSV